MLAIQYNKYIYINIYIMDIIKDKYLSLTGKSDSMYVYVLYECSKSEIISHIQNQLKIIDRIGDSYKRKLFSSRYYMLRDSISNNAEEDDDNHIFNKLIFISDTLETYDLEKSWIRLLKEYSHSNISYKYSDRFDIDFLEDLLENSNPYHVIKLNNNLIEYYQITKTKKRLVESYESKTLDIAEFIKNKNITKKYIIYGISSKLKGFVDPNCYIVINKSLKDEEVIQMIDQIDQEDILDQFDKDLEMMTDSKQIHKIIFKKNIKEKIETGQLEKIYISDKIFDKFMENLKKLNIEINFKLIKIDTMIKSFTEGREKKINQYDGVVGTSYY
jgi:hypothetical protein